MHPSADRERTAVPIAWAIGGALALTLAIVFTAWLQDDAYITLRCVRNLVERGELAWNPGDRVQVYVHPLWTLLLAPGYWLTRNGFYASLGLSALLSLGAWWILARRVATDARGIVFAGCALLLSKAFVDYSTGGIENPLSHFLAALFVASFLVERERPRGLLRLAVLGSLLVLSRADLAVLFAPPLAVAAWQARPRRAAAADLALGAIPLAAWCVFAAIYFGSIVPSPGDAKLVSLGIPRTVLMDQGLRYLAASLSDDPLTLALLAAGVATGFATRDARARAIAAGILAYLAYVVRIGGCFMSGRFFTVSLLLSVALLLRSPLLATKRRAAFVIAACIAIGAWRGLPNLFGGPHYDRSEEVGRGIYDCRGIYFQTTGLVSEGRRTHPERNVETARPTLPVAPRVEVLSSVGLPGFETGDQAIIVDVMALCDPLLSRLPPARPSNSIYTPGHNARHIPRGYLETLAFGENRIADPNLAEYWSHLEDAIRGPIWSAKRLRSVWGLLVGEYSPLLEKYLRGGYLEEISHPRDAEELADAPGPGTPWFEKGVAHFEGRLELAAWRAPVRSFEICIDSDDDYQILFRKDSRLLASVAIPPADSRPDAGLRAVEVDVPEAALGFDSILLTGYGGDGILCVGRLRSLK